MQIEIPVVIGFDVENPGSLHRQPHHMTQTLWVRYNTDPNADEPVMYCVGLPRPDSTWTEDVDGLLMGVISSAGDKEIAKRAAEDPESYKYSK